jgi:hypothetical protein
MNSDLHRFVRRIVVILGVSDIREIARKQQLRVTDANDVSVLNSRGDLDLLAVQPRAVPAASISQVPFLILKIELAMNSATVIVADDNAIRRNATDGD